MIKIHRALISLSDKSGVIELAKELVAQKVEILSTGGTAKLLRENNIKVKDVSEYTGFPEMLDGRVKTLHPKIHAGLLALRDNEEHMQMIKKQGIGLIDMVVVNLYPFESAISKEGVTEKEAIEFIDIGGPSMLRSAAKNFASVAVVSNPRQYKQIIEELKTNNGSITRKTASELAAEVFKLTSHYDSVISSYLSSCHKREGSLMPQELKLEFDKVKDLRYGENPHQNAAFYIQKNNPQGIARLKQLQGKELSFNNILDLNSIWEIVREFKNPVVVIVKHNNPCGVAENKHLIQACQDAFECDALSAFGGIVGLNREVDEKTAKFMVESGFLECVVAPGFSQGALKLFLPKKNLRLLELDSFGEDKYDFKKIDGGLLLQDKDSGLLNENEMKVVTKTKPTKEQLKSLLFAWKVAKHVKSNAIILAKDFKTVGIGAGQMSRVDSVIIAKRKAGKKAVNSCLASDGFFPKPDSIQEAAACGVKAIIQPGGSIADKEVIQVCDQYRISMVFTGMRHFKH